MSGPRNELQDMSGTQANDEKTQKLKKSMSRNGPSPDTDG